MKTADELGHRFDHNPPHDPVSVGLFSENSPFDHVGCLLRWCSDCDGQAVADVYAGTPDGEVASFPVTLVAALRSADRPNWYVCAACGSFGALGRDAIDDALAPGLKKTS